MILNFDDEKIKICEKGLLDFCNAHKRIFLYGAGVYGETYLKFLKERNVSIEAFITTNSSGEKNGIPIIKISDIMHTLDSKCGIILSVREEFQDEICRTVEFPCNILRHKEIEHIYIETKAFLKEKFFENDVCCAPLKYDGEILRNILVVQLEATFGDMIWGTAFIRELRKNYPLAKITLVLNGEFALLYENCPYVDELMFYDVDGLNDFISEEMVDRARKYAEQNLRKSYDAVFLPRLFPFACFDAWGNIFLAVYSDARYRFGHSLYMTEERKCICNIIENLFSAVIKHKSAQHEVLNDLEMLNLVDANITDSKMELWISSDDIQFALAHISRIKRKIVVGLVGSKENRSWNPVKYGDVFNEILKKEKDIQIILCGGQDAAKAADIVQEITNDKCLDMTGKTKLMQSAAIISQADLYVGSDTGLMHMASVFGVPIIEISASNKTAPDYWGSTPTRTGPWQVKSIIIRPEHGLDDCKYMCNKSYSHCINQITQEEVKEAIFQILNESV